MGYSFETFSKMKGNKNPMLSGRCKDDTAMALIDLDRYPVNDPEDPRLLAVIDTARAGLAKEGCARIAGFVRPDSRSLLMHETEELAPLALHSREEYTPYGTPPDPAYSSDHPRSCTHRTTSGSVTKDLIPESSAIMSLYRCDSFKAFIAACLATDVIHEFADPMRGLIINAMSDGNSLGWHFDANEFVVSLMTKRADTGGGFDYCPGIRKPGEENYGAVRAVLHGDRQAVKTLDLQVGDLQIFFGRYSMHQVAPVKGTRHTVIFGYAREPGFIGNAASTMRIYGRVMQAHIDADASRHADGLVD